MVTLQNSWRYKKYRLNSDLNFISELDLLSKHPKLHKIYVFTLFLFPQIYLIKKQRNKNMS